MAERVVVGEEPCLGLQSSHGMAAGLWILVAADQVAACMSLARASWNVTVVALEEVLNLQSPFPFPERGETAAGRMAECIARLSIPVHSLHDRINDAFPV